MSKHLTRWGGLSLLVAGALTAIPMLLHPSEADPHNFMSPLWVPVHLLLIAALLLTQLGLPALYIVLAERGGAIGLLGFLLSFVGSGLIIAALTLDAFVFPILASDPAGRAFVADGGPLLGGPLGLLLLTATAAFAAGSLLLGFVVATTGVPSRWAGVMLAVGGPLLSGAGLLPQALSTLGAVLFGLGISWAGYSLWATNSPRAIVAGRAQEQMP